MNCGTEVCVTQSDDMGWVACCSKNAVHIRWDFVQLRLSYGEFLRLVQRVERVTVGEGPATEPIRIDCERFSFTLPADEYVAFADLLTRAHTRLSGCAPQVFALRNGSHPLTELPLPYDFSSN